MPGWVQSPMHVAPTSCGPVQVLSAPGKEGHLRPVHDDNATSSFQTEAVALLAVHVYVLPPVLPTPHMRAVVLAVEHVAPTEAELQALRPDESVKVGHCGTSHATDVFHLANGKMVALNWS